jgi:nitrite reductase/ring-hydroxylating ferredoxin subunit
MPLSNQEKLERPIKYNVPLPEKIGERPIYLWLNDKIEVIIVRWEGKIRILNSICPHMGAQLQCDITDRKIHCPWHGLSFPLDTLNSDHHRYRHLREYEGAVIEDRLIIYGIDA